MVTFWTGRKIPGFQVPKTAGFCWSTRPSFRGMSLFCGVRWNHHFFPVSHNFRLDTHLFLCRRHLQIWFLRKTYQQQKDIYIELLFIRKNIFKPSSNISSFFPFLKVPKKETVNHHRLSHYGPGPEIDLINRWFPPPWWLLLAPSPCLCWRWHSSRRCLADFLIREWSPTGKTRRFFLQNKTWWTVEIENN